MARTQPTDGAPYAGGVTETVERWAMVVLLVAGCVLLVGAVLERDWLRTAAWTTAVAVVGGALWRRRRHTA